MEESFKISTKKNNLYLKVMKGHFATGHSHLNYYIDVTSQKFCLDEARAVAEELLTYYKSKTVVDTILCLDGTEVIGTCLAELLTRPDYVSVNENRKIHILTPEHTTGSQLIFRDNTVGMIKDKKVLVLAASVATGYTAFAAVDAILYYGGNPVGIASIFATVDKCNGVEVSSVFDPNDLPGYISSPSHECPMCRKGQKVDALINIYGISRI